MPSDGDVSDTSVVIRKRQNLWGGGGLWFTQGPLGPPVDRSQILSFYRHQEDHADLIHAGKRSPGRWSWTSLKASSLLAGWVGAETITAAREGRTLVPNVCPHIDSSTDSTVPRRPADVRWELSVSCRCHKSASSSIFMGEAASLSGAGVFQANRVCN